MELYYWISGVVIAVLLIWFLWAIDLFKKFSFLSPHHRRFKKIQKHLKKAEKHISDDKHHHAKKHYKKIQKHYKKLQPHHRKILYHRSAKVHEDLSKSSK